MQKIPIFLLLLGLCCFSSKSIAQPIFPTNEANIQETVDQIFFLYQDQIDLSYDDVLLFVRHIVEGADADACPPPVPQIGGISPGLINFFWEPVPDAHFYQAAYLSLNGGSKGVLQTDNPAIDFSNLKGLMLFGFNSACGEGQRGSSDIIIVDVDLLYPTPPAAR